jgi:peptidyl-prolyl cis-trans isomerase D
LRLKEGFGDLMLQNIRDNSQGTIAKIIVGFIIITFSLFGIESIVALGSSDSAPATVNGTDIEEGEILRLVEMQKNRFRQQFGDQYDESLFNDGFLRQSALEQLIEQKVAVSQAKSLGGYVSTQSVDKAILAAPEFQQDGEFSSDRFRMVLRRSAMTPLGYREVLANQALISQLQLGTGLSDTALPYEIKRQATLENEIREFEFVTFSTEELKQGIKVESQEVADFYTANSSRFMTEEKVSISYVILSKADIDVDVEVTEEELSQAYDEYVAQQAEHEERQASHILIEINDERDASQAKALAEEIAAKAKGGESFADLAKAYSDDIGSKNVGGDLGFNTRGGFVTAFDDVLFVMEKGDISAPVETEFGFHVIQLQDTRSPELVSLADKAEEIKADLKASQIESLFAEQAESLAAEAFENDNIADLVENSNLGLKAQTSELFTRTLGNGIALDDKIRSIAFDEKVLADRELSDVIEISADEIVVIGLSQYKDPEVKPMADVAKMIEAQLLADKALSLAADQASELVASVKSGEAVDANWTVTSATIDQATDAPVELTKAVFALAKNEGEVTTIKIADGHAVARLISVKDIPIETSAEDSARISQAKANESFYVYRQWAKANSEIERSGS